ncbi:hypothetical protein Leryth_016263, partial [Lithospermum erythrorhizon]
MVVRARGVESLECHADSSGSGWVFFRTGPNPSLAPSSSRQSQPSPANHIRRLREQTFGAVRENIYRLAAADICWDGGRGAWGQRLAGGGGEAGGGGGGGGDVIICGVTASYSKATSIDGTFAPAWAKSICPSDPLVYNEVGVVAYHMKEFKKSAYWFEKTLAHIPSSSIYWSYNGHGRLNIRT